jgi:hypothetical protein
MCLAAPGGFNAKAILGHCDTAWKVTRHGGGYTIADSAGFCLTAALERIHPPMAGTLPCHPNTEGIWNFVDAGEGKVILELRHGGRLTATEPFRPALLLPPGHGPEETQRWILRRA